MRITNGAALALTPGRRAALELAEVALEAVDTAAAVRRSVRREGDLLVAGSGEVQLGEGRLLLVAAGKCAVAASRALADLPDLHFDDGIVLDVTETSGRAPAGLREFRGTHPLPSAANVEATRALIELLQGAAAGDHVIAVVSGGASTLLCQPPEGISWEAEAALMRSLIGAGAAITEINTVRKHTSLARGGQLSRWAFPAAVTALVFSDVPGAPLEYVASGPFALDSTSVGDAAEVLRRHRLAGTIPVDRLLETPKDAVTFERVRHEVIVSNELALEAMAARARSLGLEPEIEATAYAGEAREVAARVVRDIRRRPPGSVALYGGESTVTVRGTGRGGRNAELALAALPLLGPGELVLALASDGRDNGDLAGALADGAMQEAAAGAGLDVDAHLERNDSYGFFEKLGGALVTGATGANVADLIVGLRT